MDFTPLERGVIDWIVSNTRDPAIATQLRSVIAVAREHTGCGSHTQLQAAEDVPCTTRRCADVDPTIESSELDCGGGAVVHFEDGRAVLLELYAYGPVFPPNLKDWQLQPRLRILTIDHVQLAMPAGREAEARRFYEELLGLTEVPKPPGLASRGGVWFEAGGGVKVHLGVDPDFRPARKAHPAFLVDSLDGLCRTLRDAGCPVTEDDELRGQRRIYVDDPFGNRIEFLERT